MNANLSRLMVEMQEARRTLSEAEEVLGTGRPPLAAKGIVADYGELRRQVKETVTELYHLLSTYEANLKTMYAILAKSGMKIGGKFKGHAKEIENLQQQAQRMNDNFADIRASHQQMLDGVQSELEKAKQRIEELGLQIGSEVDAVRRSKDKEIERLRGDNAELRKDNERLGKQKGWSDTDQRGLREMVQSLETKLQRAGQKFGQLAREHENLQNAFRAEQESLGIAIQAKKGAEEDRDAARRDASSARQERDRERQSHAAALGRSQSALAGKQAELDFRGEEFDKLFDMYDEMKERVLEADRIMQHQQQDFEREVAALHAAVEKGVYVKPDKLTKRDQITDPGAYQHLADPDLTALGTDNAHTQHWGRFNLQEHLNRAFKKQPKKCWF